MSKNKLALIAAGAVAVIALAVPFAVQAASAAGTGSGAPPASSDPAPGTGDQIVGVEPADTPAQSGGYWTDERLDQARPYDPMPHGDPKE